MSRIRAIGIVARFWVKTPCTRNTRIVVMTNRSMWAVRTQPALARTASAITMKMAPTIGPAKIEMHASSQTRPNRTGKATAIQCRRTSSTICSPSATSR